MSFNNDKILKFPLEISAVQERVQGVSVRDMGT